MNVLNAEFFDALDLLEKEKSIPKDYMFEKIKAAIVAAVKRDRGGNGENLTAEFDPEKKTLNFAIQKIVVDEVVNPHTEISLEEARTISKKYAVDSIVDIPVETKSFGRIAAKIGKNVIVQAINEAINNSIITEFESRQNEIMTGVVQRIDPVSRNAVLEIGKYEITLPVREQIQGETLRDGDRVKVFVVEAKKREGQKAGHEIVISRTHPGLVRRLFELEIPEINDGTIEIVGLAREAGSRTKISVLANNADVDPLGACIGPKSSRINSILKELKGEKIDIIKYSPEIGKYIAASLSPAKIISVGVKEEEKICTAIVESDQLSLAIGKEGQNVRLAAKLTGWKIDIKAE